MLAKNHRFFVKCGGTGDKQIINHCSAQDNSILCIASQLVKNSVRLGK